MIYSILPFQKNKQIDSILLVVPKNKIAAVKKLVQKYKLNKVKKIIPGGKRRQDSVLNGLTHIKVQKGIILVHDGVRPLVSQSLINKGIRLCKKYKAFIFGVPITDTIKEISNNRIKCTISRKNLFLVQTPQFFETRLIKNAAEKASKSTEYTDEAALLEADDIPVYLFQGQYNNMKITQREDLRIIGKII